MGRAIQILAVMVWAAAALAAGACGRTQAACQGHGDCKDGQVCQSGVCALTLLDAGVATAACYADTQCQAMDPQLVCSAAGLCDLPPGGAPCTTVAECPEDQFCNFQSQVCVPLQRGYCRTEAQCPGQRCSAAPGGMGRCVDCLGAADCAGGQCLANGVCASSSDCVPACAAGLQCSDGQCLPVAAACNPACASDEQCTQGVCYGADGCPGHAHPVSGQCACDDGYVPSSTGNACVLEGACDPSAQATCQGQGGTWDAVACACLAGSACDPPCQVGSACQGSVCVPLGGGACTSDLDCLSMAAGFFACDTASATCTCDAMQGILMCMLFGMEFDPSLCDCLWESATVDAGTVDEDAAGSGSDAGVDATTGAADAGVDVDAGPGVDVVSGSGAPGAACAVDDDCGGYSAAWCVDHWPGGYCGGRCDVDAYAGECGPLGVCVCAEASPGSCPEAYCFKACVDGADCRSGYTCQLSPDGSRRACVPL